VIDTAAQDLEHSTRALLDALRRTGRLA